MGVLGDDYRRKSDLINALRTLANELEAIAAPMTMAAVVTRLRMLAKIVPTLPVRSALADDTVKTLQKAALDLECDDPPAGVSGGDAIMYCWIDDATGKRVTREAGCKHNAPAGDAAMYVNLPAQRQTTFAAAVPKAHLEIDPRDLWSAIAQRAPASAQLTDATDPNVTRRFITRSTADAFRAMQRTLVLEPADGTDPAAAGGLMPRILALAEQQMKALKPYADIPLVDVQWQRGWKDNSLEELVFAELYAHGFTNPSILVDDGHSWSCLALGHSHACKTPEQCNCRLRFYW